MTKFNIHSFNRVVQNTVIESDRALESVVEDFEKGVEIILSVTVNGKIVYSSGVGLSDLINLSDLHDA